MNLNTSSTSALKVPSSFGLQMNMLAESLQKGAMPATVVKVRPGGFRIIIVPKSAIA
jgi:hypothetical protein